MCTPVPCLLLFHLELECLLWFLQSPSIGADSLFLVLPEVELYFTSAVSFVPQIWACILYILIIFQNLLFLLPWGTHTHRVWAAELGACVSKAYAVLRLPMGHLGVSACEESQQLVGGLLDEIFDAVLRICFSVRPLRILSALLSDFFFSPSHEPQFGTLAGTRDKWASLAASHTFGEAKWSFTI